jgi:PadR family transcriptional regulator, regulatory protein AphA
MNKTRKTDYAILGMLAIEPMSGYEIRNCMQESTASFWSESYGQIYPTLTRLKVKGLVTYKLAKTRKKTEKKIYQLTRQGREELKKWLSLTPEKHMVRNELVLKLFLGANVAPEVNLEHIRAERHQAQMRLAKLNEIKNQLTLAYPDSIHLTYWLLTLDYGIAVAETRVRWCNEAVTALNNK